MSKLTDVRKQIVASSHRVVIKVGTRLLTDEQAIPKLIEQIAAVRASGRQVIFVSSGAVGTGMKLLDLKKRPSHLSSVQALAAVGQVKLMSRYERECMKRGFHAAQLLLTADDLRSRERFLNTLNCIEELLSRDILPIVNENDPVSVDELKFGDNDALASLLGSMTRSDITIILTTVDGLLRPNDDGTFGDRISLVSGVTQSELNMARGTDNANLSMGGMASKLKAAQVLNSAGEVLWVVNGHDENVLKKIFDGEDIGTIFVPKKRDHKLESKKRWINSFSVAHGQLIVDNGAAKMLKKSNCSLLSAGVVGVKGSFRRGDIVEVCTVAGNTVIARGQCNFSSAECRKLAGVQSSKMHEILGYIAENEIIHRNNLVVIQ